MNRHFIAPALLVGMTIACSAAAALLGRPVWAAAFGAGLCLLYWALEALAWRRARVQRGLALGTAVGGMFLRLVVVLGALVLVGVLARPAFATAALSFLASFTVYMMVRLSQYSQAPAPAERTGVR